jgi:hypothetical protein
MSGWCNWIGHKWVDVYSTKRDKVEIIREQAAEALRGTDLFPEVKYIVKRLSSQWALVEPFVFDRVCLRCGKKDFRVIEFSHIMATLIKHWSITMQNDKKIKHSEDLYKADN